MLVVFLFAKCLTELEFGYCSKKLLYCSPLSDSEFLDNSLSIILAGNNLTLPHAKDITFVKQEGVISLWVRGEQNTSLRESLTENSKGDPKKKRRDKNQQPA